MLIQLTNNRIPCPSKHRKLPVESRTHPQPLRTLPGKHHHRLAGQRSPTGQHRSPRRTLSKLSQPRQQLRPISTNHHRPMLKHRPPRQRHPHIGHTQLLISSHMSQQPTRLSNQRRCRPPREHPRHHRQPTITLNQILVPGRVCRRHRIRGLLQNHMRVGATNPKRGHPRPPRATISRPRPGLGKQRHRPGCPIHMRRRNIHMQGLRQNLMTQRLHHLDHSSHPCGSLRMTHVRLNRSQPQRMIRRPILPISS